VQRAALTPTDLLHVSGEFTQWNAEASRQALEIFALLLGKPVPDVLAMARTAITRRLFEEVIRKEVSLEGTHLPELPADWALLLDKAFVDDGAGLGVSMSLRRPVVAIGAPARVLLPALSDHLRAEVIIPEHAEVANAVGAIGGEVVVREEAVIRPGWQSGYLLHDLEELLPFRSLEAATEKAIAACRERAQQKAREAGAVSPRLVSTHRDFTGSVSDGSHIFLERRVTATASGPPF
jgi:N-methylhydantoinase A/oxoprolinase/acetone carboxylase beta subunit